MMTKFGSVLIQLISVDSTNNYIANLIQQGSCTDGSVIMADYQTNGRGQHGNSWQSVSSENLMFSIAFQPSYPLEEQIRLSWYSALMWQHCLFRFGMKAQIKWPNDLYVNDLKIGGILIEQQIKGAQLEWAILGSGVNVNHQPDLANTTSIFEQIGQPFKPITVLLEFLDLMNGQQALLVGDFQALKNKFEAELWRKDQMQLFQRNDGVVFEGLIKGVSPSGALCVETSGSLQTYNNKEVSYLF